MDEGRALDVASRAAFSCEHMVLQAGEGGLPSSMTQTSGSAPESSTGIRATRSIQSWMALVMWGTLCKA
jgi:hypothetical protein